MKKSLYLAILGASVAMSSVAAFATPVQSTEPVSFSSVKVNGSATGSFYPASAITTISWGNATPSGSGSGYFAGLVTDYVDGDGQKQQGSKSLYVNSSNGGSDAQHPFTFTVVGDDGTVLGTFTESSAPVVVANDGTNGSSLTLHLFGDFVFAGPLSADGTQSGELTLSFTQTGVGGTDSGSGTLATPAVDIVPSVPEPSSLMLLGTGLVGGVGILRRRFKA